MNCLEFRRTSLSEPNTASQAFLVHRAACPDCARFAESVRSFDQKLLDAMRIPVPDNLMTRIKLRHVVGEEQVRRVRPWKWALAASIFVSAALSVLFGYQMYSTNQYIETLRVAAIDHVNSEPQFLSVRGNAPEDKFRRVMAAFGASVVREMEPIRDAEVCAMNKKPIAHSVFDGEKSVVTVLYVIGERLRQEISIDGDRYHGWLIPAGQGNLVVLATRGEPLAPFVDKLKQSVRWDI